MEWAVLFWLPMALSSGIFILDMKSTNIQHTKYFVSPFDRCFKNGNRNGKARRGEIEGFTGINAPYEPPNTPDLRVETSELAIEESLEQLLEYVGNKFTISKQ
jgi:adenylylsulfate kinase-like enzyme